MAISTIPTLEAIRETLIPLGYDIIPITHLRIIEAHSQELFDLESKGLIVGQEKLLRAELEKLTEKVEKLRDMMDMGRCCATCKHDTRTFCPPSCVNDNYRYWEMEEV